MDTKTETRLWTRIESLRDSDHPAARNLADALDTLTVACTHIAEALAEVDGGMPRHVRLRADLLAALRAAYEEHVTRLVEDVCDEVETQVKRADEEHRRELAAMNADYAATRGV